MNVSLTTQLDKFVQEQLASGMYKSASEVVRDGLRMLERRQGKVEALETVLDERLMDQKRIPMDKAFWAEMKNKAQSLDT